MTKDHLQDLYCYASLLKQAMKLVNYLEGKCMIKYESVEFAKVSAYFRSIMMEKLFEQPVNENLLLDIEEEVCIDAELEALLAEAA